MRVHMRALLCAAGVGTLLTGVAAAPAFADNEPTSSVTLSPLECAGDTLSGTMSATTKSADDVLLTLTADPAAIAATQTEHVVPPKTSYPFDFNVAGYANAKSFTVIASRGGHTLASQSVTASSCAPGTPVPEFPSALLVPLGLLGAAGAGVAVSRRRRGSVAAEAR